MNFIAECSFCGNEFNEDESKNELCPKCLGKQKRVNEPVYLQKIRDDVDLGKNIVCIGAAGSGKSSILSKIELQLREASVSFEILCPTGNSALNVLGITYHSLFCWKGGDRLFGMSPEDLDNTDAISKIQSKAKQSWYRSNYKRILEIKTIILDEFSMIAYKHFQSMNKICKLIRGNQACFGGIQIIAFGDPFQLRPIMSDYPFMTPAWEELNFTIHQLADDKLYRFLTAEFSDMTRMIRLGLLSTAVNKIFKTRQIEPENKITEVYFTNKDVDESNQTEYAKLPSVEVTYSSFLNSTFKIIDKELKPISQGWEDIKEINKYSALTKDREQIDKVINKLLAEFQKTLKNAYGEGYMYIKLKPGTRVVCTLNNKEGGKFVYANGTSGFVRECGEDQVILDTDDGKSIIIKYKMIDYTKRVFLDGSQFDLRVSFNHIPLRLGYAITFNRSQGMTMDRVRVSGKSLKKNAGIVYVGLSRCKDLETLHLDNLDFNKIVASYKAINKFSSHFVSEIIHLYKTHPEWFVEYKINLDTDDQMEIQQILRLVYSVTTNSVELNEMPLISSNTQSEHLASSRGASQNELRKWLLETQKQCLITGEKLPCLLEAAHLRCYSSFSKEDKIAHAGNAVLLRCDLHTLFDKGYFSFRDDGSLIQSKTFASHPIYSSFTNVKLPPWVKLEYLSWHRATIMNFSC